MDYVSLTAGEYVLVLAEHSVHPEVIGAITSAAALNGGNVSTLYVDPWKPGGMGLADPSPIVVAAWKAADVVISCAWWAEVHTRPLFFTELGRLGSRLAALHQTATLGAFTTGARFPSEVFYEIKRRVLDRVVGSSEIRVTTSYGTDIRFGRMRFDTDNGNRRVAAGLSQASGSQCHLLQCSIVTDSRDSSPVVYCRQYAPETLQAGTLRRNCRDSTELSRSTASGARKPTASARSGKGRGTLQNVMTEGVDAGVRRIIEARAVMQPGHPGSGESLDQPGL